MKRIIAIVSWEPTREEFHQYGLDYLKNNYNVSIFYTVNHTADTTRHSGGRYDGVELYVALSYWEMSHMIKRYREDAVFLLEWHNANIYWRLLNKYNCRYYVIAQHTTEVP